MDICQRIYTTHDTNGNTRAIWLAYADSGFIPMYIGQVYMEYGRNRPKQLYNWYALPELEVTPKQYRQLIADAKQRKRLTP